MSLFEALEVARRARGMTQEDLAALVGTSQVAISRYEHGLRVPDEATLARIASALGVTASLLQNAGRVHGGIGVDAHMRRQASAPISSWRRLEARLNMLRLHASRLLEEITVAADHTLPTFDVLDVSPEAAARMVRMQWRMPIGPVRSIIKWVEAAGVLVVEEDFQSPRIDGMSQWVGAQPIILLNAAQPTDRKRLTVAHELGHLVLHSNHLGDDLEVEANEFAAEFLMPRDVVGPQLRRLTITRLHDLKRMWQVSMQALIERAYSTGGLSATERSRLYKQFSSRGWRKREPLSDELTPESPTLVAAIGETLNARRLTSAEIAEITGFLPGRNDNPFLPVRSLRAIR